MGEEEGCGGGGGGGGGGGLVVCREFIVCWNHVHHRRLRDTAEWEFRRHINHSDKFKALCREWTSLLGIAQGIPL